MSSMRPAFMARILVFWGHSYLCRARPRLICSDDKSWYEGVSKSFRIGRLERVLQMVQLSSTRCSCIPILWISLVSFAAITFCVASQRVFIIIIIIIIIIITLWLSPETSGYTLVCRWCSLILFSSILNLYLSLRMRDQVSYSPKWLTLVSVCNTARVRTEFLRFEPWYEKTSVCVCVCVCECIYVRVYDDGIRTAGCRIQELKDFHHILSTPSFVIQWPQTHPNSVTSS
jgi:hypothetical protein